MPSTVTVIDIDQAIVAGDDYAVVGTITTNGSTFDLSGYTVTTSCYDERDPANKLITGHAVTLTTAASGIVTLTLLAAESVLLHTFNDANKGVGHIFDFKCVAAGGSIVHSDPWRIVVRKAVT